MNFKANVPSQLTSVFHQSGTDGAYYYNFVYLSPYVRLCNVLLLF